MNSYRIAVAMLVVAVGQVCAQPKAGEVSPDRLAFGTVYTGATVEASFKLLEPGNNAQLMLGVTVPKFVKVLSKSTEAKQFGPGNDFICGSVEIALDTAAVGELKGEVTVSLGQSKAKLAVSATVKPRRPGLSRLLVVETPFERYTTHDGQAFKVWTDLVSDASVDPSYLLVTRGKPVIRDLDLSKFDGVLLASTGLTELSPADVKKVRAFAEAGGSVVVAANHFFRGTVKGANKVLTGYGLEIRDEEAQGMGQHDVTLKKDDLDAEVVKAGVASARFFRASPVAVTDRKAARVVANASGTGQMGDGFVVIGKAGKGKVMALGESLWWNWISEEQSAGTDNAKLLRWLLAPPK